MSAKEVREALESLADDGMLARHDRRDGSFVITVPGPLCENLGQNAHVHWRVKAAATKDARETWGIATADTLEGRAFWNVRLTFNAYFCRRRPGPGKTGQLMPVLGYRPRDLDNLVAAMKPAIDGLVDAGLVTDDDKTRVRYGDHEITWVDTFEEERVEVRVEPLGGEG